MNYFLSLLFLVFLLPATAMNHMGDWGSAGSQNAPMPRPPQPVYNYSYECTIMVSDYEVYEQEYILVAKATTTFNKNKKWVRGAELSWQTERQYRDRTVKPSSVSHQYLLDDYSVVLDVNPVDSSQGKNANGDLVTLRLNLVQPIGSARASYDFESKKTMKEASLFGKVRSSVRSQDNEHRSMHMQVSCENRTDKDNNYFKITD